MTDTLENAVAHVKSRLGLGALDVVKRSTPERLAISQPKVFYIGQHVEVLRTNPQLSNPEYDGPEYLEIGRFAIAEIDEQAKTLRSDNLPKDIRAGDILLVTSFEPKEPELLKP